MDEDTSLCSAPWRLESSTSAAVCCIYVWLERRASSKQERLAQLLRNVIDNETSQEQQQQQQSRCDSWVNAVALTEIRKQTALTWTHEYLNEPPCAPRRWKHLLTKRGGGPWILDLISLLFNISLIHWFGGPSRWMSSEYKRERQRLQTLSLVGLSIILPSHWS